jgi:hypothetical protein
MVIWFGSLEFMSLGYAYDMVLLPPRAPSNDNSSPRHQKCGRQPGHHGHHSHRARRMRWGPKEPRLLLRDRGQLPKLSQVLSPDYQDRIPREGHAWHAPGRGKSIVGTGRVSRTTLRGIVTLRGVCTGDWRAHASSVIISLWTQQCRHGLLPLDAPHHELLHGASRVSSMHPLRALHDHIGAIHHWLLGGQ